MLTSNRLNLLALVFILFLVTGCANKSVTQSRSSEQPATQPEATPNVVTGEAGLAEVNPAHAELKLAKDPMADRVIPLPLVKAYDQVFAMIKAEQVGEAINQLKQLQQAYPQSSGPSYRLAHLYYQQKDYSAALDAVLTCLSIQPKNYYASNLQGIILRETGQFEKAKAAYLQSLATFPGFTKAHLNLGVLADVYLYDLPFALKYYENYMALVDGEDEKVAGWILDLKRRIE